VFFPESNTKIWLYAGVTDMRKSFDGLSALAKHQLNDNPLSGDFFVFINRRRTMMKILYFDRSGYCIWMKKLEAGAFQLPTNRADKMAVEWTQLKMILEGIDLHSIRKRKRYCHSNA